MVASTDCPPLFLPRCMSRAHNVPPECDSYTTIQGGNPMHATVFSGAILGVDGLIVEVEVDIRGDQMAADFDVELLGQIPLDASIREQTDSGTPTVLADPESPAAGAYRNAAQRMAAALASQGRDYSAKFPKIVVEDS